MHKILLPCVLILLFAGFKVSAQESEVKPSSATDSEVRIHEGKRVRATTPPKEFRPRYTEKNKKAAVNVKERTPKVQKHRKGQSRRNSKFRLNGK